jgi:hypothetical protein
MTRVLRRAAPLLLVLLALLPVAGCDGVLGPRSDDTLRELLETRQRMWNERGPASYTMTVLRIDGDPGLLRPVVLRVSGGQIVSAVYEDTEAPVPAEVRARYHTVEGLFALVRDAIDRRIPSVSVNYDAEYGFPREMVLDYNLRRSDDDLYFSVSDFTPGT